MDARDEICAEIQDIMRTYRQQDADGGIDTPGGLEHMGDVWRMLMRWDDMLAQAAGTMPGGSPDAAVAGKADA